MQSIELTQGRFATVDDVDAAAASAHSWCFQKRKENGYARARVNGRYVYLHRWILGFPESDVDHKDGNGLNCCRDNLRVASKIQNAANQAKKAGLTSCYKGVHWDSKNHKWTASFNRGEKVNLGRYEFEVSAALAYDSAAQKAWGEFAKLNFPPIELPTIRPRILIVGHGRHGKDEAAATLHKRGNLRYAGSMSWQLLPFIARQLDEPPQLAWESRHLNRDFWLRFGSAIRANDPLFLVRRALLQGNVVAGIRDKVEIDAIKRENLFDSILWVDRPGFPTDPTVTFSRDDATDFILNDGSLEHFRETVLSWAALKGYITH